MTINREAKNLLLLAAVGASSFGLTVLFNAGESRPTTTPPPTPSPCEDSRRAYIASQFYAEDRLKSPSTAEFPTSRLIRVNYIGACQHQVHAYVDAQNSFGAMIRQNYYAELQYQDGDWRLIDFTFEN